MKINKDNWFWNTVFSNKKIYYQIFLASLFINFFALMSAFYIMTVYDKVIPNQAYSSLIALTVGMFFVLIFDFSMKMLRSYFVDVAGRKLDDNVADKIYNKVVGHDRNILGESNANTVNTIREFEAFRDFFTSSSFVIFIDIPFMILFIGILWIIGGKVALVPTLIAPLVIIVAALIQPNLKNYAEKELKQKSTKLGTLMEILNGHETVRTVANKNFLKNRWVNAVSEQNKLSVVSKIFANFSQTFTQSGLQLSQTLIVFYGVFLVSSAELSMGALVACVILSGRCLSPVVQLGGILTRLNGALAAFRKIDALMDQDIRDDKFSKESIIKIETGKISLNNVSYSIEEHKIIKDININIKHGEKVGVIGPVGGGKSTFLKSIVGYINPQGTVLIDGYDISNIDTDNLKDCISYVPQTIHLFSGSISENISAGLEGIKDEDIVNAAKLANAHDFITRLPGAYGNILNEGGNNLSGGQRQKISLARSFVRLNSKIAVLDEPASSLDGETEAVLQQTIRTAFKDKTLILATHKMSLLSLVDRLIVFVDGGVLIEGPKDQVLKKLQENNQATVPNNVQ